MDLDIKEMPSGTKAFRVLKADSIRAKSSPVDMSKGITPEMKEVLWRMVQTCIQDNGVGLAAPQVGIFKKLIVTKVLHREGIYRAYFNPSWKASTLSEKVVGVEGCLSVPNRTVKVERFDAIIASHYEFVGGKPEEFYVAMDSLPARIFQHEVDHLESISILDRYNYQRGKK